MTDVESGTPEGGRISEADELMETEMTDVESGTPEGRRTSEADELMETENSGHNAANLQINSPEELEECHKFNGRCRLVLRLADVVGNVLILAAFACLFHEGWVKITDYTAMVGSAVSLMACTGILIVDRKQRYDNERVLSNLKRNQQQKDLVDILLRPNASILQDLLKRCSLSQNNSRKGKGSIWRFLVTPDFFETTFHVVTAGWVMSSCIKSRADQMEDDMISMSILGQCSEILEVLMACVSLVTSGAFCILYCLKDDKDDPIVNEIRKITTATVSE